MQPVFIRPMKALYQPGDFAGSVQDGLFYLPEPVFRVVSGQGGVRTAADFVSYLHTFPSAVAAQLNWTVADVQSGLKRVSEQLEGLVAKEVLNPPAQPRRVYGALNPADRPGFPNPKV
jgi:hypothetical protein